jgi:hypothetical protein
MLTPKNQGKITIFIDRENEKLNSRLRSTGIAKKPEVVLTTLLINFVSYALEHGKDPEEIASKNLGKLVQSFESS